jgi:hypothetical protein
VTPHGEARSDLRSNRRKKRPPTGKELGVERLAGIARLLGDAPSAHVVCAIFDALAEHALRERMPDDATVFVGKRCGRGAPPVKAMSHKGL